MNDRRDPDAHQCGARTGVGRRNLNAAAPTAAGCHLVRDRAFALALRPTVSFEPSRRDAGPDHPRASVCCQRISFLDGLRPRCDVSTYAASSRTIPTAVLWPRPSQGFFDYNRLDYSGDRCARGTLEGTLQVTSTIKGAKMKCPHCGSKNMPHVAVADLGFDRAPRRRRSDLQPM